MIAKLNTSHSEMIGKRVSNFSSFILAHANKRWRICLKSNEEKERTFRESHPKGGMRRAGTALVVDDDAATRKVIAESLEKIGNLRTDQAENGVDACVKLGRSRPDLIILDLMMPDMDGVEVCRFLKKDPTLSSIPVIIVTGYPDSKHIKELEKMGYTHILGKPIRMESLLAAVDVAMSKDQAK